MLSQKHKNKIEEAALHASILQTFCKQTKQKRKTIHFYKNKQRAAILSDIKLCCFCKHFANNQNQNQNQKRRKITYFFLTMQTFAMHIF
jgi:hypothetical protein